MAKASRLIDYLDVSMPLGGLPQALFKRWLTDFVEAQHNLEGRPRIKQATLLINSTDLIAFLGFIEAQKLNEIELKRVEVAARREFQRLLFNSIALDHQYHYKWCLAALKNLPIGRRRKKLPEPIKLAPVIKQKTAAKTKSKDQSKQKKKSTPTRKKKGKGPDGE